jgi:hypothetical protein
LRRPSRYRGGTAVMTRPRLPARTNCVAVVPVCRNRRSGHRDRHPFAGLPRDVADRDLVVLVLGGAGRAARGTDPCNGSEQQEHRRRQKRSHERELRRGRNRSTQLTPLSVASPTPQAGCTEDCTSSSQRQAPAVFTISHPLASRGAAPGWTGRCVTPLGCHRAPCTRVSAHPGAVAAQITRAVLLCLAQPAECAAARKTRHLERDAKRRWAVAPSPSL